MAVKANNLLVSLVVLCTCLTYICARTAQDSFTRRELSILKFFDSVTSSKLENGEYDWSQYYTPTARNKNQTGLDSRRYQLAFLSYAVAAASYVKTPAYPALASRILHNAFRRLVDESVWGYWSEPGVCGFPWRPVCEAADLRMCEIDLEDHKAKHLNACPDPVIFQNIMYSGHLAQVGSLYESLSGDDSLTTEGWTFSSAKKQWSKQYTLDALMRVMADQANQNLAWGGGIACEPSFVYLVCNHHPRAAFRLYDAMHGTNYGKDNSAWKRYSERTAVRKPTRNPFTGEEPFFQLFMSTKTKAWVNPLGLGGCAANDGWVLTWMKSWNNNVDLFEAGLAALSSTGKWRDNRKTNMSYIKESWPYPILLYNSELATSFYLASAAMSKFPSKYKDKADRALNWFDQTYGEKVDFDRDGFPESYMYNVSKTLSIWVTSNILLGQVIKENTLDEMYRTPSTGIYKTIYLKRAPYPEVMVPYAKYLSFNATLQFSAIAHNKHSVVHAAKFVVSIYKLKQSGSGTISVTKNGKKCNFSHGNQGEIEIITDIGYEPTHFEVQFSPHGGKDSTLSI